MSTRKKNGSVSAHPSVSGNGIFGTPLQGSASLPGGEAGGSGNGGMDIQMGIPINALAAKTASLANTQTLYQMCLETRKRLKLVQGYERFLELPPDAPRIDVVNHVWSSFRLGSSLCHLFNVLLPAFEPNSPPLIAIEFPDFDYPEGNGVLTWATLPQNVKTCKIGAARFVMALTTLKKEGRWPEHDDLWHIQELFLDDTSGLVKVLRTVGLLLDMLPPTAWVREDTGSPATPFVGSGSMERQSYMNGDYANGSPGPSVPPLPNSYNGTNLPYPRPPSSTSTYQPTHRSTPSTTSSIHGRPGWEAQPLPGSMSGGGAKPGLFINTTLDRSKSYGGVGSQPAGPNTAGINGPASAHPMTSRQGDVRPLNCGLAAMRVWEIVDTEKKYVQELEILQTYSHSLVQHSLVTPDTVHHMFSNLGKLLDFQRRFLTQIETQYEPVVERDGTAWKEGRWGHPWLTFEKDFEVYEPYCANYMSALELFESQKANISRMDLCLEPGQLAAFLVKPIQRLLKYPLLLSALLDDCKDEEYAHVDELKRSIEVTKRIAEGVNETLRQHSNLGLVEELKSRVKDWKGHVVGEFGKLLLDGQFIITKSEQDRDYSIYLFEKMILCCKEVIPEKKDKRAAKSGSILKKQSAAEKAADKANPSKKNPLSLKGRIYVNNLTAIEKSTGPNGEYALKIIWRQQDDPGGFENFVMHVKSSETINKWESEILKLMKADALRREERDRRTQSQGQVARNYSATGSSFPRTPSSARASSNGFRGAFYTDEEAARAGQWEEDGGTPSTTASNTPNHGYPIPASRRTMSSQGIPHPSDRYMAGVAGPSGMRSASDETNGGMLSQWRGPAPAMPPLPRNMSAASTRTEASFGNVEGSSGRPGVRNVGAPGRYSDENGEPLSSGGLPYLMEGEEVLQSAHPQSNGHYPPGMHRAGSMVPNGPSVPNPQHPAALRNRSASSPNVYQAPRMGPSTPLNGQSSIPGSAAMSANSSGQSNHSWNSTDRTQQPGQPQPGYHRHQPSHLGNNAFNPSNLSLAATSESENGEFGLKRFSNSTNSTEISELSSHSPETPYGAVPELAPSLSGSRHPSGDSSKAYAMSVIVKVHFGPDVFKLAVPSDIDCYSLKEKVTRKVRLCGGCREGVPIKCYYRDPEDEDDVLRLDADEDIATLFQPVIDGMAREVELQVKA